MYLSRNIYQDAKKLGVGFDIRVRGVNSLFGRWMQMCRPIVQCILLFQYFSTL